MLKQLIAIFTGDFPLKSASTNFTRMLELSREMVLEAGAVYWGKEQTPDERTNLDAKDVTMNQLERKVRKAVITHMSGPGSAGVPYALLLMSLVKDVERVGDYAKNLSDMSKFADCAVPEGAIADELREVWKVTESIAQRTPLGFADSDKDSCREIAIEARATMKRCDALVATVAKSDVPAQVAVRVALGARFIKRILGHYRHVVASVLMPLHDADHDNSGLEQQV